MKPHAARPTLTPTRAPLAALRPAELVAGGLA
jgi:hypothetical protein